MMGKTLDPSQPAVSLRPPRKGACWRQGDRFFNAEGAEVDPETGKVLGTPSPAVETPRTMPSDINRGEFNELTGRVQQLADELMEANDEVDNLRGEVNALRQEVADLKAAGARTTQTPSAPAKPESPADPPKETPQAPPAQNAPTKPGTAKKASS